jgi:hypothetical protein
MGCGIMYNQRKKILNMTLDKHTVPTKGASMTDFEIIDLFDSTNITLARLSEISLRSVGELQELLMSDRVTVTYKLNGVVIDREDI